VRAPAVALALLLAAPAAAVERVKSPGGPNSAAPSLAVRDGQLGIAWLEDKTVRFSARTGKTWTAPVTVYEGPLGGPADPPRLSADPSGWRIAWTTPTGEGHGSWIAHATSKDGRTWRAKPRLHENTAKGGEIAFPALFRTGAAWLDGTTQPTRLMGRDAKGEVVLDAKVCDCCTTSAAQTLYGPVVVYRNRDDRNVRDISIVRRLNGGWTPPRPVGLDGWVKDGCPVNGPAVAADGESVGVAWYTGAGGQGRVRFALSRDGGATFARPAQIDGERALGKVALTVQGREGYVTWLARDGDEVAVRLARVGVNGRRGASRLVATAPRDRLTGTPDVVRMGDTLWVAWRGTQGLKLARMTTNEVGDPREGRDEAGAMGVRRKGAGIPTLTLPGLDGRSVQLPQKKGKPLLVNLWATWCRPCVREMPEINLIESEWGEQGLQVVGISIDADLSTVERAVEAWGLDFEVLHDAKNRSTTVFDTSEVPSTYLYDRQGRLVWYTHDTIEAADEELRARLRKVVQR
jgi:thiol-disulfide isomerase/thioredoxin